MTEIHARRLERKKLRKKRLSINSKLKKRLFRDIFISPCHYCRKVFLINQLTIEHLNPLCLGGDNSDTNIALACAPCNHQKGREAWFAKRRLMKDRYEQHSDQHQK